MAKLTVIVGRAGFQEQLETQLAQNATVEAFVHTELEALAAAEKLMENFEGQDGGRLVLFDTPLEAYPIEVWEDEVPTLIGWEVEGYGGAPVALPEVSH